MQLTPVMQAIGNYVACLYFIIITVNWRKIGKVNRYFNVCAILVVLRFVGFVFRFKLLFSLCDDKESRKRTTRASILAANRAASSSSESEEVKKSSTRNSTTLSTIRG